MKRQNILDGAYESFVNFGYKGTTMDKIAKTANVGKGTIYRFFNTKEDLLEEIVMAHIYEMKSVVANVTGRDLNLEESLQNILYEIFKFKKENQLIIKLIQEQKMFETKEVTNLLSKIDKEIIEFIKERIQYGIDKGILKKCNSQITAFVIMKMYIALITDWEVNNKSFTKEELVELFNLYIFTGIKNSERRDIFE